MLFGDGRTQQTEALGGPDESVIPFAAWKSLSESLQLSRRELEIIQFVFADEKDGNIAGSLGISRHTVDTYVRRLYAKLEVSSRPQLILRVVAAYLNQEARSDAGLRSAALTQTGTDSPVRGGAFRTLADLSIGTG
jgi:DNA-binding CsgD family transcriptional regulator